MPLNSSNNEKNRNKSAAGDVGGHYTLLFRKIKGEWVIVADHSS